MHVEIWMQCSVHEIGEFVEWVRRSAPKSMAADKSRLTRIRFAD